MSVLFAGNYGLMRLGSRLDKLLLQISRKHDEVSMLQTFTVAFYASLYLRTANFLLDYLAGYMAYTMKHRRMMTAVGAIISRTNLAHFGVSGIRIGLYGKFNGEDRGNRINIL